MNFTKFRFGNVSFRLEKGDFLCEIKPNPFYILFLNRLLDNLLKMVQSSGAKSVVNNPAVPKEHNEGIMQAASSSIMDTLKI